MNTIQHPAILILIFLLFIPIVQVHANKDSTATNPPGQLVGTVSDFATGETLPGVNVYIKTLGIGASTDADGNFRLIGIPAGEWDVVVSYTGYEAEIRRISIPEGEQRSAKFHLREGIYEFSTVVVTGTANAYLYEQSPVKTEVVPHKLIEQSCAVNLAEALCYQTGVRVENSCQNCNFTQVRLLGFDGKYSQVLIDSDPVVSSLSAVYALEHFPDEMIEQIEVVKGGGSALYGGGAVAGTINMRTRYPLINRSRLSYTGTSLNGTGDHKVGAVAELVSADAMMGAYVYVSARERGAYDHNNDNFSELGTLSNNTEGLNSYLRPWNGAELQLSLHHLGEDRRGGSDFGLPVHEARIAEWVQYERWGGKLRWEQRLTDVSLQAFYSFSMVHRDSYYGGLREDTPEARVEALRAYGDTENDTHIGGLQGTLTLAEHTLTGGMQYSSDHINDRTVEDAQYHVLDTYTNFGMFIEDAVSLLDDHLTVIGGVRLDKHSALEQAVISPRANIRAEILHDLFLRAGFTTGFKAPQVFDEDLHIESLGGEQRIVRNTAGLEPERSRSISGGIEYLGFIGDYAVMAGLTAFHTRLSDAFTTVSRSHGAQGAILWERINADGAQLSGVEADLGFKPVPSTELRLGLTWKNSRYDSPQEIFDGVFSDRFLRTPDLFGYLRVTQEFSERFNLFGAVRYTGTMVVPNEVTKQLIMTEQTFIEIDLGLQTKLSLFDDVAFTVNLGVKNLTDAYQHDLMRGVDRDPAYLYGPQLPRRFYLSVDVGI